MRILHLFPKFPDSFWSYGGAIKIAGKRALLPPLGSLTVAAMLPREWEQRLVDLNVRDLTDADLAWADVVFISAMGVQWRSAQALIAQAKAAGKHVVAGGPLFTAGYALFQNVDTFMLNEAELTIASLAADLTAGTPKRIYRTREFADMTQSPVPRWDLAERDQYAIMGIQFSRGCPFDCDFCNVTAMLGKKPRIKTGEQIIAELDALYATGWRDRVFFVDDNLIGNKKPLREDLLPKLIEWQKTHGHLQLCTQVSINLADDPEITRLMVEAGFSTVFIGIETSDPESLEECQKKQNRNRDLIADVKKLQRAGLEVQAGFIVGFDHDTAKTFQQQVDFINESGIVTAMIGQLQAPPGTRLRTRMALEGRLRGVSLGDNTDGTTNIVPTMGLEPLRQGHAWMLTALYSPKPYYQRIRTLLRETPPPAFRGSLRGSDLKSFSRACWRLGVMGRERWEYFKLFVWTLTHCRKLLPMAIRLAAIGHHHRVISEDFARRVKAGPAPDPLAMAEVDQGLAARI
jgi:radical SAM superfamily enzyme YgiQ (UPF0313 family)